MARAKGRRARRTRRVSRITPRRWLPFVLLVALAAAAVAVGQQVSEPDAPEVVAVDASAQLPVAAVPEAMSTAWFCSGGSAQGSDGAAELSVVIANGSDSETTADVRFVGNDGQEGDTAVEVPASSRVRVTANEHITAAWVAATVEVLGDQVSVEREVRGPDGHDLGGCSSATSDRWYVPSGSTLRGATARIVLYNPLPGDVGVDITFASDEGSFEPRALQGLSVPGGSVVVVPDEHLPSRRAEMAATIVARSGGLVVDRVQIYDGSGDEMVGEGDLAVTTDPPRGLTSKPAIPAAHSRWLVPDAVVEPGSRSQLAFLNPGEEEAEIDLQFIYEEPARLPEVEPVTITVSPGEQRVLDLTEVVGLEGGIPFSVAIDARDDVPVVADLMVFGAGLQRPTAVQDEPGEEDETAEEEGSEGEGAEEPEAEPDGDDEPVEGGDGVPPEEQQGVEPLPVEGYTVVGATPLAATTWHLASHGGNNSRSAWVVVVNPGSTPADVSIESFGDGTRGAVDSAAVTVPAGDRRTLDLTDVGDARGLVISSDAPVVVVRSTVTDEGVGLSRTLGNVVPGAASLLPPREQSMP